MVVRWSVFIEGVTRAYFRPSNRLDSDISALFERFSGIVGGINDGIALRQNTSFIPQIYGKLCESLMMYTGLLFQSL
jgi:hypothetical protein